MLNELIVSVDFALRNRPYGILGTTGILVVEDTVTVLAVFLHTLLHTGEVAPTVNVGHAESLESEFDTAFMTYNIAEVSLSQSLVLAFHLTDLRHTCAFADLINQRDSLGIAAALLDKSRCIGEKRGSRRSHIRRS